MCHMVLVYCTSPSAHRLQSSWMGTSQAPKDNPGIVENNIRTIQGRPQKMYAPNHAVFGFEVWALYFVSATSVICKTSLLQDTIIIILQKSSFQTEDNHIHLHQWLLIWFWWLQIFSHCKTKKSVWRNES